METIALETSPTYIRAGLGGEWAWNEQKCVPMNRSDSEENTDLLFDMYIHTCILGSLDHRIEVPGKLLARQVRADVDDDVVVQLDR